MFFLIDCSSGMEGAKIAAVDAITHELRNGLEKMSWDSDADVEIAVLKYSGDADGPAGFGEACMELSKKMSNKGFIRYGAYPSAVILFSGSNPTGDYGKGLEALLQNVWFRNSTRLALPIGKDVNLDMLAEFAGSKEAVLSPANAADIINLLSERFKEPVGYALLDGEE